VSTSALDIKVYTQLLYDALGHQQTSVASSDKLLPSNRMLLLLPDGQRQSRLNRASSAQGWCARSLAVTIGALDSSPPGTGFLKSGFYQRAKPGIGKYSDETNLPARLPCLSAAWLFVYIILDSKTESNNIYTNPK